MSNSATIKIALKIDDQGGVRVLQNVGKESTSTGQKGKKAFNDMDRSAKSFNDTAKMSVNTMLKMGAGLAGILGLAKAWGMLKDSAKQYLELASVQEAAENKLEAVLKATGYAAGYNLAQLKAMASGLQDVTTVGDETTLAGMAILATFKEIKGEAFEGATKAAMDMSQVMGQDLKSSMVQIGKALNDPIQGLSALSRVGVSFTDGQKDMIKTLQESGDVLGAQKVILAELQSEFGGAAEAASKIFAGGLDQAKNALGDTKEEMGFVITKNQFFIELTHMATAEFKRWGEETQKNRGHLMDLAKDGVLTVVSSLKAGIETMRFFHNGWSGIKLVGQTAVQALAFSLDALYPIIRSLLAPLDALYQGMVKLGVMDVNPFDAIGKGLATFKDSSAQVTQDVLADIDRTNQKYDTVSNTLQGYIDKIKKIPVAVSETAKSEKAAHGLRMGQFDEQAKAFTELTEKELKALQEANQKKYAMDIALANKIQEDTWLIREKGLKKAIELNEDTQTKITQMEYDEEIKRNEKIEKAYEDSLKEQTRAQEQFVENVQDVTADKFYDLFSSPRTFWKNALDEMTDYFYRLLAQWAARAIAEPIIVPVIQQVGGGIASALGFGGSGSAGSGLGFGNILSAGQSLWGAYSGTTSNMAYNILSQVPGLGFGGAISSGALAAGGELGWGASAMASLGTGTGAGGLAAGIAAAVPWLGIAAMAIPLISSLLKDDPDPRVGVVLGDAPYFKGAGESTSSNYNYYPWLQDIGNKNEMGDAVRAYMDAKFGAVEAATGIDMDAVTRSIPGGGKAIVNPEDYGGDIAAMLAALENGMMKVLLPSMLKDLDAGLSGLIGAEFFDSIKQSGESALDTFIRFGAVVNDTGNFTDQFTRQLRDFGETAQSAFKNISVISGIMATVEAGMASITDSTVTAGIESIVDNWSTLMDTLDKSHATLEDLTTAEIARNVAIGTQLTGLTANSIQGAIINGQDITGIMQKTIASAMAGVVAESVVEKYILPLNEQVGKAYLDSAGDLNVVLGMLSGADFSGAQSEINAFRAAMNAAFGVGSTGGDTVKSISDFSSQINQFDANIQDVINKNTLTDYQYSLSQIYKWYTEQSATAKELGLSVIKLNQAYHMQVDALDSVILENIAAFDASVQDIIDKNTLSDYQYSLLQLDKWYENQKETADGLGISLDKLNQAYDLQKDVIDQKERDRIAVLPVDIITGVIIDMGEDINRFNANIQDIIDKNTLSDYAYSIFQLDKWYAEQAQTAQELGISIAGLVDAYDLQREAIEQAEATRIREEYIDSLESEISALRTAQEEIENAFSSATDAYTSGLNAIISEMESELSRFETIFDAAKTAYVSGLESAKQSLEGQLISINDSYASMINSAIEHNQALADSYKELAESTKDYRDTLTSTAGDPTQNYDAAKANLLAAAKDMSSSDNKVAQKAIGDLSSIGDTFLAASKAANNRQAYQDDYAQLMMIVNAAADIADARGVFDPSSMSGFVQAVSAMQAAQASAMQQQIDDYQATIDLLKGEDAAKSLLELQQNYFAAKTDFDNAKAELDTTRYQEELLYIQSLNESTLALTELSANFYTAKEAMDAAHYATQISYYEQELAALAGIRTVTNIYQISDYSGGVKAMSEPVALAEGGTVFRPTLALIGEGGEAEHVTPDSQMQGVKDEVTQSNEWLESLVNTMGDINKKIKKLESIEDMIDRMLKGVATVTTEPKVTT